MCGNMERDAPPKKSGTITLKPFAAYSSARSRVFTNFQPKTSAPMTMMRLEASSPVAYALMFATLISVPFGVPSVCTKPVTQSGQDMAQTRLEGLPGGRRE